MQRQFSLEGIERAAEQILGLPDVRDRLVEQGVPTHLKPLVARIAEQAVSELPMPARSAFDELRDEGCNATILGMLLLVRPNHLLRALQLFIGPVERKKRLAAVRTLEQAVAVLKQLAFPNIEPADSLSKVGQRRLSAVVTPIFRTAGRALPSVLAGQLDLYVLSLTTASSLDSRTATHLPKFLLTGYVEVVTREPHDRQVATLLSEVLGLARYNTDKHRVWRNRHYRQFTQEYSGLLGFLAAIHHQVAPGY